MSNKAFTNGGAIAAVVAGTIEDTLDRWRREEDEGERDRLRRKEARRIRESAPGYVPPPTAAELERLRCHPAWSIHIAALRRHKRKCAGPECDAWTTTAEASDADPFTDCPGCGEGFCSSCKSIEGRDGRLEDDSARRCCGCAEGS